MSKWRYTVEYLASGQPRPYADHRNHARVTFEIWQQVVLPNFPEAGWRPSEYMTEEHAKKMIAKLTDKFTEERKGGWGLSLVRFEKVAPGVFEFVTTQPYTG